MTIEQSASFRDAVLAASKRGDIALALSAVYQHLQDAIDLRRPVCNTSGRCCRFDEFGHRLFVTTIELATFVSQRPAARPAVFSSGCPYQIDGLCSVHAIRPFGCRVFFCDETAQDWQNQQYERLHSHLKRLHDDLKVPYFYLEWRQALAAMNLAGQAGDSGQVWDVGAAIQL